MSWPDSGWRPGHPQTGHYYFFRMNGYGPFESYEKAQDAAFWKHGSDPYWRGKDRVRVRYQETKECAYS